MQGPRRRKRKRGALGANEIQDQMIPAAGAKLRVIGSGEVKNVHSLNQCRRESPEMIEGSDIANEFRAETDAFRRASAPLSLTPSRRRPRVLPAR